MNDTTPLANEQLLDLSSLNLQNLSESFSSSKETKNPDDEKFVVFFLDDELFAVAADQIAEIVRPLNWTTLPNSPVWLHGIANLRGEIISVLNLAKICHKRSTPRTSKSKLIVLKPKIYTS